MAMLLTRPLAPRFASRRATVDVFPNAIRISAGMRSRTVRAASLAAGLVVTGDGCSYVLITSRTLLFHKRPPISLRCSPSDAERIRVALGIERSGRGLFEWETRPGLIDRLHVVVRIIAAFVVLNAGIADVWLSFHDSFYPVVAAIYAVFASVAVWFLSLVVPKPTLLLSPEGIVVPTKHGAVMVGRSDLRSASRTTEGLEIEARTKHAVALKPSRSTRGLADDDRDVLAAVIDAVAKAEPIEERDPLSALLERGEDSTARWLARLDALTTGGADAYRAALGSVERVLEILESPDEHADVRMGAARVLARTAPDARKRIDDAVAAMADEALRDRVRIAMTYDSDEATELLEDVTTLGTVSSPTRRARRT
jgi:hypothetical protein